MSTADTREQQVVDWSAAIWAGLIAGVISLFLYVVLTPRVVGGNSWVMVRLLASILLGEEVLAPPASFHGGALACAVLTHLVLSVAYALVLAFIIHRGGLITGIRGGGAFGLALYLINFYSFSFFFPWFFAMQSWAFAVNHILFGALAGGIYEALEVEEFVPANLQVEDASA